ncbi:MAG TPA: DUF2203 domain-containing protein [Methylomirabilota bacterium]|nr:DUF2203 domain-containing protein [Methylomirabilota bacterium]
MAHRFQKHYTREEARALLPELRTRLQRLNALRRLVGIQDRQLTSLLATGDDLGGQLVNDSIRSLAEMRHLLLDFHTRQIQIKDIERGLVDFPALIGGREVFLCWEMDEEDIEYWHELDSGYAGRERLT